MRWGTFCPKTLNGSLRTIYCALGFLIWNWAPAKIFMGDVGSVPLGYLIGWLLISVVVPSNSFGIELMTIVLLPAYYYADSTITIIRRFLCKKNIFQVCFKNKKLIIKKKNAIVTKYN